jgi:hypothetical protein
MILCFTTDDPRIVDDAYAGYAPHVFGIPYCYLPRHGYRGLLGQAENLFISAHGNDHEIGNERGQPAYTPQQLRDVLVNDVLPGMYTGRIYVSACSSAPVYVNNLRQQLGAGYVGRVFGMFGAIDYEIAPPASPAWRAAA